MTPLGTEAVARRPDEEDWRDVENPKPENPAGADLSKRLLWAGGAGKTCWCAGEPGVLCPRDVLS